MDAEQKNNDIRKGLRRILLVNSYSGSGIGDFGRSLLSVIKNEFSVNLLYRETQQNWRALLRNCGQILRYKGITIINLGFTSYGSSMIRNFLNFAMLSVLNLFKKSKIRIILHDSPEIVSKRTVGYSHFNLKHAGSKISTKMLSANFMTVFSIELYNLLKHKYRFNNLRLEPFPCSKVPDVKSKSKMNLEVIHVGYISEYKGLDILPQVKTLLNKYEFVIIGGFHAVLTDTLKGRNYITKITRTLRNADICMKGYLDETNVEEFIGKNKCVGVLPYISTSGSSYSAIYMIERGLPIVASNLPEFKRLQNLGVGMSVVNRDCNSLSDAIRDLLEDEKKYVEFERKNIRYCEKYNMHAFVSRLVD